MKIGFITCDAELLKSYFPTIAEPLLVPTEPMFTPDDQIAVNALRKKGFEVDPVVWGCTINTLKDFNLLIVRSPWDYYDSDEKKENFLLWLNAVEESGIPIANPVNFMRWNLDKHYLNDLNNASIPVIPTKYYEKKSKINLIEIFKIKGPFILKSCISAAGKNLFFIDSLDAAENFQNEINQLLQNNSFMLQDYVSEIKVNGEWSMIFLNNQYSHAIHKITGKESIFVHAERGGGFLFTDKPKPQLIDFANQVYPKIATAFFNATNDTYNKNLLLYLRLDILETKSGYVVIECEGIEPELFFRMHPSSKDIFCDAVEKIFDKQKI